tara:strand:- start:856 stop:1305 length:450 start_codon:yes stop_codon:yes gene_type:complete
MLIKARKKAGRLTENQTIIETALTLEGVDATNFHSGVHTVEKVSGSDLFVGLDSEIGTTLNFNVQGDEDWTDTNIFVTHKVAGDETVLKVVFTYRLTTEVDAYDASVVTWWNDGEPLAEVAPTDNTFHTIKSGNVTVNWEADTDGDWST